MNNTTKLLLLGILVVGTIQAMDESRFNVRLKLDVHACTQVPNYIEDYKKNSSIKELDHVIDAYTRCLGIEKAIRLDYKAKEQIQ